MPGRRLLRAARGHPRLAVLAAALIAVVPLADLALGPPLRRWTEQAINANLKGYHVRLARFRPRLGRLGFALGGLTVTQDRHPDPPVADVQSVEFRLLFRELLRFRLAGNLALEGPALHINLVQLQEEARSKVRFQDRGWQEAVETIIPVSKLDRVEVRDGTLLYRSADSEDKPLRLTRIAMLARNVHNIAVAKGVYPSPVSLEGALFDTGRVSFFGAADFLREPYAGVQGRLQLEQVPLDRLGPLIRNYQLQTRGGLLSLDGLIEANPDGTRARLANLQLDGLELDYLTSPATRAAEAEHGRQALALARSVRQAPRLNLQADRVRLTGCRLGFVNEGAKPPYRLFLSGVDLDLERLSNQAGQPRSRFQARGLFMGSAATSLSGGFQAAADPPDFDLRLQMQGARLVDINDFLRASAGIDVAAGELSVYTELAVKQGRVQGYVKPLVKDLKVSDRRKDQGKPLGKRVELHLLQALAGLFKNRSSQEVATVARVSGPAGQPKVDTWEAIRRLFGNGLVHAVPPGFGPDLPAPRRPVPAGRQTTH